MKKKLAFVGLLGFVALFGCSQIDNEVEAGNMKSVTIKKLSDDLDWGIYELKHDESGCKYIVVSEPKAVDIELIECDSFE